MEAGGVLELRCENGPAIRGPLGPTRVFGHAEPFALHPDQREVAAGGTIGDVALVEHDDALPEPRQPPGDRRADKPAAADREIVRAAATLGHRSSPSALHGLMKSKPI